MRDAGLVDIERLSTVSDLTDSEREFRCRDSLDSLKPPREREDRAQRMSISAGSIIADAAGSSVTNLRNAERHTRCRDLLDSLKPPREPEDGAKRRSISDSTIIADATSSYRFKDHEKEAERRTRARKR